MKINGKIISVAVLLLIAVLLILPYIEFQSINSRSHRDNQLIDLWFSNDSFAKIILITLFYPFLLILEATYWKHINNIWKRLLFFFQSLLILYGGFIIWFIMSFHLFTGPYDYQIAFYLILIYLSIGVVWSLLLSIPYFDRFLWMKNSFKILSLKR